MRWNTDVAAAADVVVVAPGERRSVAALLQTHARQRVWEVFEEEEEVWLL